MDIYKQKYRNTQWIAYATVLLVLISLSLVSNYIILPQKLLSTSSWKFWNQIRTPWNW